MFLEVSTAGGSLVRLARGCNFTWSTRQTHCAWEDCTSSWPFGKQSLAGKENSGVTQRWREFNRWPKRPDVMVTANRSQLICAGASDAGRCKSNRNATMAHSSSSELCFLAENTQSTHRSAPVHLQTCFASLPLVTQHTKARWEPEPT